MKFEAKKAAFLDALQMASSAIPSKSTLQILYNFLLRLQGNQLEVTATDLDMTITLKIEVEGHQDGEIVINAKKLLEVVKELPDYPVLISVDDNVVNLKSESGFHCNLTGFDAAEYPGLPEVEGGQEMTISGSDLKFLHEKSSFAVSTDFTRISLTGVYWESKENQMNMVATDGHRLGKGWIKVEGKGLKNSVILPPKALQQVLRMAEGEGAMLQVEVGEANAKFATDKVSLYTKLIEGPYPAYENVMPKEYTRSAVLNREAFSSVLRRVATMAHAKTKLVKFSFSEGQLVLSARNPDLGGDSEESTLAQFTGDPVEIGLNAGYLLEEMRLCHTEEITLKMNSSLGPVRVEPVGESPIEGSGYFFIVMPLRLVEED